jgi:hypothetical protein
MLNKVANVVRRVVKDVRTPERSFRNATKPPRASEIAKGGAPASGPKPAAFVSANKERRPRVYFHEEVFDKLSSVFAEAVALRALMPVPEGEEEEEEITESARQETSEAEKEGDENDPDKVPPEEERTKSWGDWDGSLVAVESALDKLERRVSINPEWTKTDASEAEDATKSGEGDGSEADASSKTPPETAAASLLRMRESFDDAYAASLVPASRADLLASSLAETLALALDGVERAARRARRAHEPRPAPTPEQTLEGEAVETPAAGDGDGEAPEAPKEPEPEPRWMRRYRTQLAESIFDMLGDAIDDFEGPGDIGYEAAVLDVKAETDRRAEALEAKAGERRRASRLGAVADDFLVEPILDAEKRLASGASLDSSGSSSPGVDDPDGDAWEAFEMRRRQRQLTRRDPGEGA